MSPEPLLMKGLISTLDTGVQGPIPGHTSAYLSNLMTRSSLIAATYLDGLRWSISVSGAMRSRVLELSGQKFCVSKWFWFALTRSHVQGPLSVEFPPRCHLDPDHRLRVLGCLQSWVGGN